MRRKCYNYFSKFDKKRKPLQGSRRFFDQLAVKDPTCEGIVIAVDTHYIWGLASSWRYVIITIEMGAVMTASPI